MQNSIKNNRLLFVHIFFWCLYFSFFLYQITYPRRGVEPDYLKATIDTFVQVIFMAGISYFNYFVLLSRFANHKNLGRYILELLIPLIILGSIHIAFKRSLFVDPTNTTHTGYFYSMRFVTSHIISTIFIVSFIGMLRFAKDWFELEAQRKEIENEKLVSELRFLKEQINPHFLFNTLNNLYYLAHTNSPKTKDIIAKLSQMMRYMIYEANNEKVPVGNEIEYIKNYIDLEKLRLEEDTPIDLQINGNYEQLKIAPLIFITFLENAFKHGVEQGDTNSWVSVNIDFVDNKCTYIVSNSLVEKADTKKEEGIGLSNTKRRLNLSYPGKHSLEIGKQRNRFDTTLTIELD